MIRWPNSETTTGSIATGTITSSTSAEAAAAAAGLRAALEGLTGSTNLRIWLVFDSHALLDLLRRPPSRIDDPGIASTVRLLVRAAKLHSVAVVWVPGHAGIHLNKVADQAARQGAALPQPPTRPSHRALKSRLKRRVEQVWAELYDQQVPPDNLHRIISGGTPLPQSSRRPRQLDVALCRLRANRAPFLQATLHRWGRVDSPACPHCGAPSEDTRHFIEECPRWARSRAAHLGNHPSVKVLQENIDGVASFLAESGVLARPPYAV